MTQRLSRRDALLAAGALLAAPALAQSAYPDRTLRIIVPQTAGGPSDVLARLFAQKLTERLGKPVIVEDRPGAGSNIGTELVAKSRPDGYTLLINIAGILAINQTLYKQLPFDAVRDLDGVARVVNSQLALVAHPSFVPNNIRDLVTYAKLRPAGSISYGSAGTGSPQHVGGELLNTKAGIKLNHVAYKGAIPALQDLLGGQIPLAIIGLPAAVPNIKGGRLKAIAVFGATRSELTPDVPTFVESGFPDIEMELAYGIFTAKGTPRPIVDRLNEELGAILRMRSVRDILLNAGFEAVHSSPEELDTYLNDQVKKWRPIVRASGAVPD